MHRFVASLQRLFHTLRYLKPTQLGMYALRRGFPSRNVELPKTAISSNKLQLLPLLPVSTFINSEHEFTCHNVSLDFSNGISWNPDEQSRLWRYHLHYFDQLRDPRRSIENKQSLIDDWISSNPQGSEPAWEPYTTSLRIVNWTAYMLGNDSPDPIPQHWLISLYEQTLWLEQNDERHILANHYFENIKAWLFAGALFQGEDADRWLKNGQRLLIEQLQEQFLPDGGHYERSPHYHALMLENLLDLLNLGLSNPGALNSKSITMLKETAMRGLEYLHRITMPNNRIPMFNDSIQHAAPPIDDLYGYAQTILNILPPKPHGRLELINKPDSGLYGYRKHNDILVIDCGDIGPDYQPGHTHCDFLSFELMLDGLMIVVDSGVYEYQAGEMRSYVRSTAAHNTVSVDGQEQSEIWGEFRVARRAKKLNANIAHTDDSGIEFCGSYSGFPQIPGGIIHQRKVICDFGEDGDTFTVNDFIQGKGTHKIVSFLHFHPDIELDDKGDMGWNLIRNDQTVAHVIVMDTPGIQVNARVDSSWYCPEFGIKQRNKTLIISTETELPACLSYKIMRAT